MLSCFCNNFISRSQSTPQTLVPKLQRTPSPGNRRSNVFIAVAQWQSWYKPPHFPILRLVLYPAALGEGFAQTLDTSECPPHIEAAIEELRVNI